MTLPSMDIESLAEASERHVSYRTLGEVCEINPKLQRSERPNPDTQVTFVPMAAVDEVEGKIESAGIRPYGEVAKGYSSFADGDVLFAKITPCMENGKAAIASSLSNGLGFGSTEFFVLRAGSEVLPEWVFYFIRQASFRRQAKSNFTGSAGQQRVPKKFLESVGIPIPSIQRQRRIVDILKRADGIRHLRNQALDSARQLIPALFVDMFGDPATNPKGWPMIAFGEAGQLDRGKSKHRPRNDPALFGGNYPFIQTGDVANSGGRITAYSTTYNDAGLAQSKLWPKGILCITIAANIADAAVLDFDACFPDSVVGFIPSERVTTEFVQYWLGFLKPTLEASAPQLAQKNINLKILRQLPMILPPLELEKEFSRRVEAARAIQEQQSLSAVAATSTFDTLLARAFDGGL